MWFFFTFRLYCRDPHQLFELLCIQLKAIAIAYSDGLKKLIKPSDLTGGTKYNAIELLNCKNNWFEPIPEPFALLILKFLFTVVLDGYDKFCATAKKMSSLLFELQRDVLQNFSLTWVLLNKRMFQRWVYFEVRDLIPLCIVKVSNQSTTFGMTGCGCRSTLNRPTSIARTLSLFQMLFSYFSCSWRTLWKRTLTSRSIVRWRVELSS